MVDGISIRGGADEVEAAVIAVVLDHIEAERRERAQSGSLSRPLPAWVRAALPARGETPLTLVWPASR